MSEMVVVTGVLVDAPHKRVQKWARFSALLAFFFYSTMAIDSTVKYRPEYIASAVLFSVLPFVFFYFGTKHNNKTLIGIYCVVQVVSATCSVMQILIRLFYIAEFKDICNKCKSSVGQNNCTVIDEQNQGDDCNVTQTLNIVYIILYASMIYVNIQAVKLLQLKSKDAVIATHIVVETATPPNTV